MEQECAEQERARNIHDSLMQPCSDEVCEREYGYPQWPKEMRDPTCCNRDTQWLHNNSQHNNYLVKGGELDQEIWNEAARQPWAKALLRKEQHWNSRRNQWLHQHNAILKRNRGREEIGKLLKDCPMEVKRLVTPILKYSIVESLLLTVNEEAKLAGLPFRDMIQHSETMTELQSARQRLDAGGDVEAQRLQDKMDSMVQRAQQALFQEKQQEEKARGRTVIDMQGLKTALDLGQKCKKDGLIEWERGNVEEALASWRQGDEALRRFCAPLKCTNENLMINELHSAVLRNLAQAAIKLECWGEAIDAADRALELDSDDHKAWFRKACALEGLGKFADARECLERIEEIAVGRPDRIRLTLDCQKKKQKYQVHEDRNNEEHQRMVLRGFQKSVFSDKRSAAVGFPAQQSGHDLTFPQPASVETTMVSHHALEPPGTANLKSTSGPVAAGGPGRPLGTGCSPDGSKTLTRDGARELLSELDAAYREPAFVKRVDKLIMDVLFDTRHFIRHLGPVALEVQKPILAKWGFEPTAGGLQEMRAALRHYVRGPTADRTLQSKADEVHRALHGSPQLNMYERVMSGA